MFIPSAADVLIAGAENNVLNAPHYTSGQLASGDPVSTYLPYRRVNPLTDDQTY